MRRVPKRRSVAVLASMALLTGLVGAFFAPTALADHLAIGTGVPNTNACQSNVTGDFTDIPIEMWGTGAPDPITIGSGDITLSDTQAALIIGADLFVSGYNLGLLGTVDQDPVEPGIQDVVPTDADLTIQATNATNSGVGVDPGSGTDTLVYPTVSFNADITIFDPDGTPGTGDESADPLTLAFDLPDSTWAPVSSGPVEFRQTALFTNSSVAGGIIQATFNCQPGVSVDNDLDGANETFTPQTPTPFETVTVTAPPTAPVANDDGPGVGPWGNATVGGSQSVTLDLTANDADVNNDLDPASTALGATSPSGGNVVFNGDGTATYTNTDPNVDADPGTAGQQEIFTYTVDDLDATTATSNEATVTITVLANACTADPSCSLSQILTAPVAPDVMTMEQADKDVLMAGVGGFDPATGEPTCTPGPVQLNGQPQVACGLLNQLTVINARGTDAGWDLTGQVTDFSDGTIPGNTCPASDPTTWNNHCIPGDNLGWFPSAAVAHDVIPGDVASVDAGAPQFPANPLIPQDPTGLESSGRTLCSAPATQSGGTFTCDAGLALGVPASAAAGNYVAVLTLTLA